MHRFVSFPNLRERSPRETYKLDEKKQKKKTKEKKKGRKRKTPPWRESESRLSFVRDSFALKNLHPSASGIALDEIIRYLAEGRRLALDHYARQQEKGGAKKQGRERTYEKMVRLPVGGEGAKGRRGGSGRRVDTFEEGSVDAVAPASQWLLRHSSARERAPLRAVFGPDVRDCKAAELRRKT